MLFDVKNKKNIVIFLLNIGNINFIYSNNKCSNCKKNTGSSKNKENNNDNENRDKKKDKEKDDFDENDKDLKCIFTTFMNDVDKDDPLYEDIKKDFIKQSKLIKDYLYSNSKNKNSDNIIKNFRKESTDGSSAHACCKLIITTDEFNKVFYLKNEKEHNVKYIDILKKLNLTDLKYKYSDGYLLTEELTMENFDKNIFKSEYIKNNGIKDLEDLLKKIKNFKFANIIFAILNLKDCHFLYRPDNLYLTKDNNNNLFLKILDIDVNNIEFKRISILCSKDEYEKGDKNKCFYHTLSAQIGLDFLGHVDIEHTGGLIKLLRLYNSNKLLSKLLFSCNFDNLKDNWKLFVQSLNQTNVDNKKDYESYLKDYKSVLKYLNNFEYKEIVNDDKFLKEYINKHLTKDIKFTCLSYDVDNIIKCFNEIIASKFADNINNFYEDFLKELSKSKKVDVNILKQNIENNENYLKIFLEFYTNTCGYKEDLFEKIMDPNNFTEVEKKDLKDKLDILSTSGFKENVDNFKKLDIYKTIFK